MYSFNPCKINFARLPIVSGSFVCIKFTKLNTFDSLLISGENRHLTLRLFNFVLCVSLIQKGRWLKLPTDIMLKLFDSCVAPILLYVCEVWGYEGVCLL